MHQLRKTRDLTPHNVARSDRGTETLKLMVVGDLGVAAGAPASEMPDLVFVAIDDVSAETLALVQPDVVLAPLVAPGFDCFDLANLLVEAGFTGRLRAAANQIPDPNLVRREVAASFPGLDFDIFVLDPDGTPNLH